jgi:protein-ribulosamine 3-kinase
MSRIRSYRTETEAGAVFMKEGPPESYDVLAAEAAGLAELRDANAVRVPQVLDLGSSATKAWLAIEWLQLGTRAGGAAESMLGEQLALQHRRAAAEFGWHRDNTIGLTPQLNGWSGSWVTFFRERRLRYQLDLAARNGYSGKLQERAALLLERVGEFFTDYQPISSLLHGDLWGGNWGVDDSGRPVIFDPAVYYGDREADLAMTRLFGGFGADFYAAYETGWPIDVGARTRRDLYNLYHVLNHANLFGDSYLPQARALIEKLLAALG